MGEKEQRRAVTGGASPHLAASMFPGTVVASSATQTSLSAPSGGVGSAAGGYDTSVNRDLMITSHNALVADFTSLRTSHEALLTALRAAGFLS